MAKQISSLPIRNKTLPVFFGLALTLLGQTLNSYFPFEVLLFVFLGSLIFITDILMDFGHTNEHNFPRSEELNFFR
jgi:hypothetical protein